MAPSSVADSLCQLSSAMAYNVYTTEEHGQRNHQALYVETKPGKGGKKFHVVGTVLNGMNYEVRETSKPILWGSLVESGCKLIGTVKMSDMTAFEAACETIEVPGAQVFLSGKPKDPSKPVRRCGDWVRDAKAKLIADRIVHSQDDSTSQNLPSS